MPNLVGITQQHDVLLVAHFDFFCPLVATFFEEHLVNNRIRENPETIVVSENEKRKF